MSEVNELAKHVLEAKYYAEGESTPDQLFHRVAKVAAIPDVLDRFVNEDGVIPHNLGMYFKPYTDIFDRVVARRGYKVDQDSSAKDTVTEYWQEETKKYYDIMCNLDFMPGTPTLINAGQPAGMLSSCFFLRVPDSMEGIMETNKQLAMISKAGGGVGLDISTLRPKGTPVSTSTKGTSSGPVSFLNVFNETGNQVQQGGVRRAALIAIMSIDHPDVIEFIKCKEEEGVLSNFNLSVLITDKFMQAVNRDPDRPWVCSWLKDKYVINKDTDLPEKYTTIQSFDSGEYYKVKDIWNLIVDKAWHNGEPGVIFWDELNRGDIFKGKFGKLGVNPCITGDTKIATADGRGEVTITQLAKEGKDVPVFCTSKSGKLDVQYLRNPRITGKKQPIYKITLDDGGAVRTTKNHKFILEDGSMKEAGELHAGDSLKIVTKYNAKFQEILAHSNSNSQDYAWIHYGTSSHLEHRYIAGFHNNIDLLNRHGWGLVVHHNDYNGLNNLTSNLTILSRKEHSNLHRKNMLGDKNSMRRAQKEWTAARWDNYKKNMSIATKGSSNGRYITIHKQQIEKYALDFTKKLGRRFSTAEWNAHCKKLNLPHSHSKYRQAQVGTAQTLAKWAASELNLEYSDLNPRTVRLYKNLLQTGLNCTMRDKQVIVKKVCENCGKQFDVPARRREVGFCSISCANYAQHKDPVSKSQRRAAQLCTWNNKKEIIRKEQCRIFNALKFTQKHTPLKSEWVDKCKEDHVSFEISRKTSPFRTYAELKTYAGGLNHKVVSVELDGYEDVYNGTVDIHHNYFIGGWASMFKGKRSQVFVNTKQCGELPLLPYESCNLGAINLGNCWYYSKTDKRIRTDYAKIEKLTELGIRFLDNVVDINNFPLPEIEEWTLRTRRVGLGTMGLHDLMLRKEIKYGSEQSLALIDTIYSKIAHRAQQVSIQLGKTRGVPEDLKFAKRRNAGLLTVQPTGTVSIICNQTSSGVEPVFQWEFTRKDSYGTHQMKHFIKEDFLEDLPDYAVTALEVTPEEHIHVQAQIQKYIDSSISKTVNLPNNATREQISNIFKLAHETKCKSTTVYRSGSRHTEVLITDKELAKEPQDAIIPTGKQQIVARFRGPVLFGATFKINTPGGKAYITINEDDNGLREVFVHISKAGSEITTHVEAEGRLISHSLKHGIPATTIIGHLADHKSNPIFDSGRFVKSVPDAVAIVMREYLDRYEGFSEFIDKEPTKQIDNKPQLSGEISGELCPDCGEVLYQASGCNHCYCGFSQCG